MHAHKLRFALALGTSAVAPAADPAFCRMRAGLKAFATTPQLGAVDKLRNALALGTSPIVRAVIDPEGGMQAVRKLDHISFSDWFLGQGGNRESLTRMWDPIGACQRPTACAYLSSVLCLSEFS
jgi:zeta-carotene desaturase